MATRKATGIGEPTNDAKATVEAGRPFTVDVQIEGTSDLLFHRWGCDAVAAKAAAAKSSRAKKSDDVESYVYRDDAGDICLPGEYLRQAILGAARFRQDPRSPRKSAMDLYKAAVVVLTPLASLGVKQWDYEDRRRVTIHRAGITRVRPAVKSGWRATVRLMVLLPEYLSAQALHEVATDAGRLIGVGDFRPTFGRFLVKSFDVGFED